MNQSIQKVPKGWHVQKLAEVCNILIGGTPSRNKAEYWDTRKNKKNIWVSIADLSRLKGKYIADSSEYISNDGVNRSNVKKIEPGTVLMSFKLSIGKIAIAGSPLYTNEAIAAFEIKQPEKVVSDFLYYILPTLSYETDQAVKGKTLNKEKLKESEITLPTLTEQKKIALILSTVDEEIQKTDEIISATEKLKGGLMQELFTKGIGHTKFKKTKIGMAPEEWGVVLLDSIAKRGSGHTPNKQHPEYWNGGIKWVSLSDSKKLDNRYISETDKEISIEGIENSSAVLHPKGTIIVCRDAAIGRVAILGSDRMAVSQHFITWRCSEEINNFYLYYFLQSQKGTLEQIATGTTIKTIGLSFFKSLLVPLPSIDEQEKIGDMLWSVDDKMQILKRNKGKLTLFKNGLMRDLLSGRVRTNV